MSMHFLKRLQEARHGSRRYGGATQGGASLAGRDAVVCMRYERDRAPPQRRRSGIGDSLRRHFSSRPGKMLVLEAGLVTKRAGSAHSGQTSKSQATKFGGTAPAALLPNDMLGTRCDFRLRLPISYFCNQPIRHCRSQTELPPLSLYRRRLRFTLSREMPIS